MLSRSLSPSLEKSMCGGTTTTTTGAVTLPQWLNAPMELQMQGWIKEHQKWQADIAARGGKGLTAAQAKKHQEWQENPVRLVLLDASRHVAFPPGDGRASKGCKGLHIQMIMAPEELKVKVGGTFRSLSVRQYLDGEECPITTQVNDTLLQPLHNSIVANAGEEEDEEAAGGIPLDDAEEHVAGQALGKANPEEVDGAVEWDFCVGGRREGRAVFPPGRPEALGDYQRLLPPRKGVYVIVMKSLICTARAGARIQRYAPPGSACALPDLVPENPGDQHDCLDANNGGTGWV